MNDRITQALTRLFECHRIVFWYDAKKELRGDFESLQLSGVEKLEIVNNEFKIKYRILREEKDKKFLLYREGPQPEDQDNWLLDVQLSYGEFRTDQAAIWLSELELGLEFADLVQVHGEFFQAAGYLDNLKKLLASDDTRGMIRLKMLAVCTGSEPRLDAVVENLLAELAEGRDEKIALINQCGLDAFLWEQMTRHYGYKSEKPGIYDFVIELFKSCYAMGTDGKVFLSGDALVFLKRWKDSRRFEESFEILSEKCAEDLGIEQDLAARDFKDLIDLDYFRHIDRKIISDLVHEVESRTVAAGDVVLWVRKRRHGHWFQEFCHLYNMIDYAARFLQIIDEVKLTMDDMADGVHRYTSSWFQVDQLYRKFLFHARASGQASLTDTLTVLIENFYSNNFLLKVNDCWQSFVDKAEKWNVPSVLLQKDFFEHRVQPFVKKKKKICVIVSDALRYEIGDELLRLIRQEDRYEAELSFMLSMLPSYTQLGMAALLPNDKLTIADNESGTVHVDGQSSQGTVNRIKILSKGISKRVTAMKLDEIMLINKENCRKLVRDHDVLYIYQNRIDATGDKKESEERVFEAVNETLQELIRLIKKLVGANVNNLLVTSDHGFIYQNKSIDESDYSGSKVEGKRVIIQNRRFVIGDGLKQDSGLRKFKSSELGLSGSLEVSIPKSINRLRRKGAGSRFVHGGASLQEVVLPILRINKKRQSDISVVEVKILQGAGFRITSNQLGINFYQAEPVTDKVRPRILRAGIYTRKGDLISDIHDLTFDMISDSPREREQQIRFMLTSRASEENGKDVILRLSEKQGQTSHYREYKSCRYEMGLAFKELDF